MTDYTVRRPEDAEPQEETPFPGYNAGGVQPTPDMVPDEYWRMPEAPKWGSPEEYWNDPGRIVRYWNASRAPLPGQEAPSWAAPIAEAYDYLRNKPENIGKPWYEWGKLGADDPVRQALKNLPAPPAEQRISDEQDMTFFGDQPEEEVAIAADAAEEVFGKDMAGTFQKDASGNVMVPVKMIQQITGKTPEQAPELYQPGEATQTDATQLDPMFRGGGAVAMRNGQIVKPHLNEDDTLRQQFGYTPEAWAILPQEQKAFLRWLPGSQIAQGVFQGAVLGSMGGPIGSVVGSVAGGSVTALAMEEQKKLAAWNNQAASNRAQGLPDPPDKPATPITDVMNWFDIAREELERITGVAYQVGAEGAEGGVSAAVDVLRHWDEAWQVAHEFYNIGGAGTAVDENNRPIKLNQYGLVVGEDGKWRPPERMVVFGTEGVTEVQQGYLAEELRAARQALVDGTKTPEQLYAELEGKYGVGGQVRELISGFVLDPLNALPEISVKGLGAIGRATDRPALAGAAKVGHSALEVIQAYGTAMRQNPDVAARATSLERWVAGFSDMGRSTTQLRDAEAPVTGNPMQRAWSYLTTLTPQAKANEVAANTTNALQVLFSSEKDPEMVTKMALGLTTMKPGEAVDIADGIEYGKYFQSAEAQPMVLAWRDQRKTITEHWEQYKAAEPQRSLMHRIADAIGDGTEKAAEEIIRQLHQGDAKNADSILTQFKNELRRRAEAGDASAKSILAGIEADRRMTGETLKKWADMFSDDNGPAFRPEAYRQQVIDIMETGVEQWSVKWFGVKPDNWFFRASNLVKQIQSIFLLGNNPTYLANNGINNLVTMAWDGLLSLSTHEQRMEWMRQQGIMPARLRAGATMADIGDIDVHGGDVIRQAATSTRTVMRNGKPVEVPARTVSMSRFLHGADKWQAAQRMSQHLERASSEMATYHAMREFWERTWTAGNGFDHVPGPLRQVLESVQPGLTDKVERAIARGLNKQQIETEVFGNLNRRSLSDVLAPEEKALLSRIPGLYDQLEQDLGKAQTPADVRRAFGTARDRMQMEISNSIIRKARAMAEQTAMRMRVEGVQGALDAFDGVAGIRADFWLQHFKRMDDLFREADKLSGYERDLYIDNGLAAEEKLWNDFQNIEGGKLLGIIQGLGSDATEMAAAERMMLDVHTIWDGYFKERSRLYRELAEWRRAAERNPDEVSARYREVEDQLDQLYQRANADADSAQAQIDEIFATGFERQFAGAKPQALAWRKGIQDVRGQQEAAMRYFRTGRGDPGKWKAEIDRITGGQGLQGMNRTMRDAAWKEFIEKVYAPLIREQADATGKGAAGMLSENPPTPPEPRPGGGEAQAPTEAATEISRDSNARTREQNAVLQEQMKAAGVTIPGIYAFELYNRGFSLEQIAGVRTAQEAQALLHSKARPEDWQGPVDWQGAAERAAAEEPGAVASTATRSRPPKTVQEAKRRLAEARERGDESYNARHEAGTGAYNRTKWEEDYQAATANGGKPVVALLDVRGLKGANEGVTPGGPLSHAVGDAYLEAVVQAYLDEGIEVYRYGGDEFTALFGDEATANARMQAVADRISQAIIVSGDRRFVGGKAHYGLGKDIGEASTAETRAKRSDPGSAASTRGDNILVEIDREGNPLAAGVDTGAAETAGRGRATAAEAEAIARAGQAAGNTGEVTPTETIEARPITPEPVADAGDISAVMEAEDLVAVTEDGTILEPEDMRARAEPEQAEAAPPVADERMRSEVRRIAAEQGITNDRHLVNAVVKYGGYNVTRMEQITPEMARTALARRSIEHHAAGEDWSEFDRRMVQRRAEEMGQQAGVMELHAPKKYTRDAFLRDMEDQIGGEQASAVLAVWDQIADTWAKENGKTRDDWYELYLLEKGGQAPEVQVEGEAEGGELFQFAPAPKEEHPLVRQAREYFGVTRDLREAGYITPDGTLLDFSGKRDTDDYELVNGRYQIKQGRRDFLRGQRYSDHREINQIYNMESGTQAMVGFMRDTNSVRIDFNSRSINIFGPLTREQVEVLLTFDSPYIDVTDPNTGYVIKSYDLEGASQRKIRAALQQASDLAGAPTTELYQRAKGSTRLERGGVGEAEGLAQTAPQTQEFRRWFGDSKVVGEDGAPLGMYHGTSGGGFEIFSPEKQNPDSLYGPGFYFTDSPDIAGGTVKGGFDDGYRMRGTATGGYAWAGTRKDFANPLTGKQINSILKLLSTEKVSEERATDLVIREVYNRGIRYVQNKNEPQIRWWLANEAPEWFRKKIMGTVEPEYSGQPTVYPVYLSIQNPFDMGAVLEIETVKRLWGMTANAKYESFENAFAGMRDVPMTGDNIYRWLEKRGFGGQDGRAKVNEILKKNGYDGITHIGGKHVGNTEHRVYIAFDSEQIKSVHNQGTFNPNDPSILRQGAKGSTRFIDDGRAVIRAFESADVSTFIHEPAHLWLTQLGEADRAVVIGWMREAGIEIPDDIDFTAIENPAVVRGQEMFARGFERYMAEGKAPTPKMQGVFDRFKNWMLSIYQKISGSQIDVKVSDEVRAMFDRWMGKEEVGAPAEKQPWQMTREEWEQTPRAKELVEDTKRRILDDAKYYATRGGYLPEAAERFQQVYENAKKGIYDELQLERIEADLMFSDRWQSVKDALQEGKPVPPEVLVDYPDLVLKYMQPWQMKSKDYVDVRLRDKWDFSKEDVDNSPAYSRERELAGDLMEEATRAHRKNVETAIREGKPVPPEVLADYPDLAPQPEPPAPRAPSIWDRPAQPRQMGMFESGEDTPLFSGTAQRAQAETFAPKEAAPQPALFDRSEQLPTIEAKKVEGDQTAGTMFEQGPAVEPTQIITDAAQVQEIRNAIAEGELILRAGTNHGRKLSPDELAGIRRQVNRDRAKIGETPTLYQGAGGFDMYTDWPRHLATDYTRKELEARLAKVQREQPAATARRQREIERQSSTGGRSQARAHASNISEALSEEAQALRLALQIYDRFPEHTKEGGGKFIPYQEPKPTTPEYKMGDRVIYNGEEWEVGFVKGREIRLQKSGAADRPPDANVRPEDITPASPRQPLQPGTLFVRQGIGEDKGKFAVFSEKTRKRISDWFETPTEAAKYARRLEGETPTLYQTAPPDRNRTTATGADPNQVYEFRFKVVDLGDLTTSHTETFGENPDFPQELQPRQRGRAAGREQVDRIARELQPDALLTDTRTLDRGPMIVGADGIVESGNGRTMALRRAATDYPEKYAAYVAALREKLGEYGLTEADLEGVERPVLVRERVTETDRAKFAAEANQSGTMQMSDFEKSLQDAGLISDEMASNLTIPEGQGIDQALNSADNVRLARAFAKALPENERSAIVDADGNLSQAGVRRLRDALFAKVYQGQAGARLLRLFSESIDPVIANVKNALYATLARMSQAEGLIGTGARDAGLSLADDIAKVTDIYARLKQRGVSVGEYTRQMSMFESELDPFQLQLLQLIDQYGKRPKTLREIMDAYAQAVIDQPHPQQMGLLDSTRPTKGELLDGAVRKVKPEAETDFAGVEAATRPAAGTAPEAETATVEAGRAGLDDTTGTTAGRQPAPEPPAAVGAPLGTTDRLLDPPLEEAQYEGMLRDVLPMLARAEQGLLEPGQAHDVATLPPGAQKALRGYLGQVYGQMGDTKMAMTRYGQSRRDFALLNYTRRYGIDNLLGSIWPYQFWYTRSMLNWAVRALDKPAIMANYSRLHRLTAGQREREGYPTRLKKKNFISMPFLPEWMGGGVYVDPYRQIFPFEQLAQPFQQYAEEQNMLARRIDGNLQRMVEDEEITAEQAQQAMQSKSGPAYERAKAAAQNDIDQEIVNPLDFAFAISSPSLPVQFALNYYNVNIPGVVKGSRDRISQLPVSRLIQTATSTVGIGGPGGFDPEAGIRKALNIPQNGVWAVDRMLASMVAEPGTKWTADDAKRAMIDRKGDMYNEALARNARIGQIKYVGAPFSLDFFPEGEANQRALQKEYAAALDAKEQGDATAITRFYDAYPEYAARVASFDKPEERLKYFLISEVWEGYHALSTIDQRSAREQLGDTFNDAFLNKETRSYDSINLTTLSTWAKALRRNLPEAAPDAADLPLKLSDPATGEAYKQYLTERNRLFPGIGQKQTILYGMAEDKQRAYRSANPDLDAYQKWRDGYLADHEAIIPYAVGEKSELYGYPASVQTQVYRFRAEKEKKYPTVDNLTSGYFAIAEEDDAGRAQYLKAHPELKAFWDWRRDYAADHTDVAKFVLSDEALSNAIKGKSSSRIPEQLQGFMDNYYQTRDRMFPGLTGILDQYYKLPEGSAQRKAMYQQYPQIKQYYEWRDLVAHSFPDASPYLYSNQTLGEKILSTEQAQAIAAKFSPAMQRTWLAYLYSGEELTAGGRAQLERILREQGWTGSVEAYLEAAKGLVP